MGGACTSHFGATVPSNCCCAMEEEEVVYTLDLDTEEVVQEQPRKSSSTRSLADQLERVEGNDDWRLSADDFAMRRRDQDDLEGRSKSKKLRMFYRRQNDQIDAFV